MLRDERFVDAGDVIARFGCLSRHRHGTSPRRAARLRRARAGRGALPPVDPSPPSDGATPPTSGSGRRASSRLAARRPTRCSGGRVRGDGARVTPSKDVHVGDAVEVSTSSTSASDGRRRQGIADRRGPATVAETLFCGEPQSIAAARTAAAASAASPGLGADLGQRPTKQARRQLDALRRARRGR